ncbi:MAG TPA: response regulator [Anaerolineales bacterium]|nr:response regulator [Anaerolineales bacterium]
MSISTGPILIVEDIASVRELIEIQLKLRGYNVVSARDGQEALDFIAKERPAVVLTDILMPRVDGFALAHKLRTNPQTSAIPIIFLSATYVSAEDERFALGLGAMRFLPKPVNTDELLIAVADALTGQAHSGPPMSERDFYTGHRQRLESKLRQKAQQITRNKEQLGTLPEEQRETYRRLIAEAQQHYDEIQRELAVLVKVLQELSQEQDKHEAAPPPPDVS